MVHSVSRIALGGAVLALLACGEQAQVIDLGPIDMSSGRGEVSAAPAKMASTGGKRAVVVPEALQGKYQRASLSLQVPGMSDGVKVQLPLDGVSHPTEYGKLLVRDYLPAFMMQGEVITSDGAEEKNPALWVEWQHEERTIFRGWLFRNYPDLGAIEQPDYRLSLLGAE